jgi:hypothetical protein
VSQISTAPKPTSKSGWKKAGVHTVTLPSGVVVEIRIPNLAAMAQAGELDNDLLQYAVPDLPQDETEEPTPEQKKANLTKLANFHQWLVSKTLVDPALSPEEVKETVPTPDLEVLVELASRRRDVDVVGHHIGGLEVSAAFRTFRGIESGDEDILDR